MEGFSHFWSFITVGFRGSGAPVMFVLIGVGFISMGLVIERIMFLFGKCGTNSNLFMSSLSKFLHAGDYEKAKKFAGTHEFPLAKAVAVILNNRGKGLKAVQRAVDEVFLTESPKVTKNLGFINMCASLAVLIGLMGTIYGFMEAFDALGNVPAAQRATVLAGAIAVVMSSTLWGLIVSILSLTAHSVLSNKADKILEEFDEKTVKLINMVEE